MQQQRAHIEILPSEPRCRPFSTDCGQRASCARAIAARGTIDEPDLSVHVQVSGIYLHCPKYLSVENAAAAVRRSRIKTWPGVTP